jgi:hypothetical protein
MFKIPQNDAQYYWTNHVTRKMMFYGITPNSVKRIIRNPKRSENGVAPKTVAVMFPVGKSSSGGHKSELWTMYQQRGKKKVIITAWRYPGISPVRDKIPMPSDILEELKKEGLFKIINQNS